MFGIHLKKPMNGKEIAHGGSIARLEDVSKQIGDNVVLNNVTLDVKKGDFVIITGFSGAGKSTAIRTLQGLEQPDCGKVEVFGEDWYALSSKQRKSIKVARMAIGFQHDALDTGFSITDNIQTLSESKGRADLERVAEMASRFGLMALMMRDAPTHKLSGGERQRVALARHFVDSPELALLDEPLSGLDKDGKVELYHAMHQISRAEGTTVVVVEHDKEVARNFANREIVFDRGQVVADFYLTPHTPAA